MAFMKDMIEIDLDLCDGCGQCLSSCAEGALSIADGKARVNESCCDGFLHCLGSCPKGALKVVARPAEALEAGGQKGSPELPWPGLELERSALVKGLTSWPIKFEMISPKAPFLSSSELVLAADCTAFAFPGFQGFLAGRPLLIGCPKFNADNYADKLTSVLLNNPNLRKITVVMMTVPCCQGLKWVTDQAASRAGRDLAVSPYRVSQTGQFQPGMES
ncbi:MAG: 4Fe-4S ferredoxin [Deltaproteobacteria bacterium]|jgi:NAD-dependent dihydropyrimidine dehydrogenase PreA subunit|nr:4Fe-4S ferredoxin [Deltaproteobacteria bacterium]